LIPILSTDVGCRATSPEIAIVAPVAIVTIPASVNVAVNRTVLSLIRNSPALLKLALMTVAGGGPDGGPLMPL
jgi:hypothetical protein